MRLESRDLGKKYTGCWVFRHLHLSLQAGDKLAIIGSNGSGKSTLIQILGGMMFPSEGDLKYTLQEKPIDSDNIRKYVAFASPYLLLPEHLTGWEIAEHWFALRPVRPGMKWNEIFESTALKKGIHQPVRSYSSGMKSRLKLGLAMFTDAPIILLDEPTSNMDQEGIEWYRQLLTNMDKTQILIIASNTVDEYQICTKHLDISKYPKK